MSNPISRSPTAKHLHTNGSLFFNLFQYPAACFGKRLNMDLNNESHGKPLFEMSLSVFSMFGQIDTSCLITKFADGVGLIGWPLLLLSHCLFFFIAVRC
ncbi:hypothetical protein ACVXG7_29095, partial [Enterobacter hormaechei]